MAADGTESAEHEPSWDGVVRRSFDDVELRVLNEDDRTIEVIASTESLDSHGDKVKQFWDLTRYDRNPVVLWNHNQFESSRFSMGGAVKPEDLLPIGQSIEHGVKSKKLIAKVKLASAEYNAMSQRVFLGCKERVIRAVSVGFRPGTVTAVYDKGGAVKHYELGSAESPNELLEISFVPMGSNPEAVAKSVAFERKHFAALAVNQPTAPRAQESQEMNEQEKAAHAAEIKTAMDLAASAEKRATDAEAALKAAKESASTEKARADKAEADLAAEKAASKVLEKDLADAKVKLDAQKTAAEAAMVKSYVGTKLAPTEEAEYVDLAKQLGAERVEKLIKGRPDLAVIAPATASGKPIVSSTPAPTAVESDSVEDKANEIANALMKSAQA